MTQSKEAETDDREAVYYAVLATLDSLPTHEARSMVVMNWVKYVMLTRANEVTPGAETDLAPAFSFLCTEFALDVLGLPALYRARGNFECDCSRCKARAAAAKANVQ